MATNWQKVYAMKKQAQEKILKVAPTLRNDSGIYILTRDDESGLQMAYIGQAKHIIDRLVSHLNGYSQRIDISLKKRGFYDEVKRPYGWKLDCIYTLESELDDYEEMKIKEYALKGYQLYNQTAGKQGKGKVGINDWQSNKGYRQGLKQGYQNCLKDIKEYFIKYLNYAPKNDSYCFKKNGELKEIYLKKEKEFSDLLNGGGNDDERQDIELNN